MFTFELINIYYYPQGTASLVRVIIGKRAGAAQAIHPRQRKLKATNTSTASYLHYELLPSSTRALLKHTLIIQLRNYKFTTTAAPKDRARVIFSGRRISTPPKTKRKVAFKASMERLPKTPKAPHKGRMVIPAKIECIICISNKSSGAFVPKHLQLCEHLKKICKACVGKMVRDLVTNRRLAESVLLCPFPECGFVVDIQAVKQMVSPGIYEL